MKHIGTWHSFETCPVCDKGVQVNNSTGKINHGPETQFTSRCAAHGLTIIQAKCLRAIKDRQ